MSTMAGRSRSVATIEGGVPARPEVDDDCVGERLRAIRRQKGLSLHEVEVSSEDEFKASVLGAYERGERSISVPRLQRLARYYEVPVDQLLPGGPPPPSGDATAPRKAVIDLRRAHALPGPEADLLRRYLASIQVQRQDFNGRLLTIRNDDLRTIACVLGVTIERANGRLAELGLLIES
jgi:transcriptional regulator with XRE-family HTH domain